MRAQFIKTFFNPQLQKLPAGIGPEKVSLFLKFVAIIMACLLAYAAFYGFIKSYALMAIILAYSFSLVLYLFLFKWTGAYYLVANLAIASGIVTIFASALINDGMKSPGIFWCASVPIFANFIMGPSRGIFVTYLSILCVGFIFCLEISGHFFPNYLSTSQHTIQWFLTSVAIITCMYIFSNFYELTNMQINQEIQKKNSELQKLITDKRNLLRALGHDLINPLSVTTMTAERAIGRTQDEKQIEYWKKVQRASQTQLEIMGNIRKLEALETNKIKLNLSPVDIKEVVEKGRFIFQDKLQEKGIEYSLSLEHWKGGQFLADPISFSNNVFNNLISNAIKFTPEGGKIVVEILQNAHDIIVKVIDNGIGIPPEILEKLFSPNSFSEHTTRSGTNGEGGTGFGMNLVQSYMEKFHGTMSIESREGTKAQIASNTATTHSNSSSNSSGTTITLTLPLIK